MIDLKPILIGIWCGVGKPKDLNEFLSPFVYEMNSILDTGININGYHVDIESIAFIADSPARAHLKGILINRSNGIDFD